MKVKALDRRTGGRGRGSARLRAQAREVYRDAILQAAEEVFVKRGLSGTRMSDVAGAARLATGTLYNYFANRDALLASLIEQRTEELLAEVRAAEAAEEAGGPRAKLERMVRAGFQHFDSHRALFAVLGAAGGIQGKSMAGMPRRCMEAIRSYHDVFAGALGEAVEAGLVRRDVPISILVGFLTGALHGVMRTWIGQGGAGSLADQAPAVVDLFRRGASSR